MRRRLGLTAAILLTGASVPLVLAQQTPPLPTPPPSAGAGATFSPERAYSINGEEKAQPRPQPMQRRSIVHHYPYPYPEYYHGDSTGGFRNPSGAGRYIEYYPPGNQFQVNAGHDPVRVATFGGGGVPDRAAQLAAQQIGINRYNAIQGHIDNMARPAFGVGFFGGWN